MLSTVHVQHFGNTWNDGCQDKAILCLFATPTTRRAAHQALHAGCRTQATGIQQKDQLPMNLLVVCLEAPLLEVTQRENLPAEVCLVP